MRPAALRARVRREIVPAPGAVRGKAPSIVAARHARRLAATVFTSVFLTAAPAFATYDVAPRICVESENVTLADLVPGAPTGWAKVNLGRAPSPGRERTLSRAWVRQKAGLVGAQDEIQVPDEVVLTRPGQGVDRERLVEAVRSALEPRVGSGEAVRVVSVGLPGFVPQGPIDLKVRIPNGVIPSPTTLWVDVLSAGVRKTQGWVRVELHRSRPVVALARDLRRGDALTPEDLEVRAGEGSAGALVDPAEAVGKLLVRNLQAGAALTARDLQTPTLVDRGAMVHLVARVGGVTASTLGKALEKGGLGERVQVENLSSGRTVTGVVRDGGVVDVISGLGR